VPIVVALVGCLLVAGALLDAANTLVSTRLQVGRFWPSEIFYRAIWPVWGSLRHIKKERRREIVLSAFGPASLLGLLLLWVIAEIVGWAMIWWALRESFAVPLASPGDALYFSGIVFFTIGFGDIVPGSGVARALTLVEAFGGLGTLALVIGYLPALYSAYSARESQLLMLDDLSGDRITPISLIESHAPDGDVEKLYAFFHEWERWTAQLLETHTSYPMLSLFRSQHLGQSWVTALGVVTDAAAITTGCIRGADERESMRMYRRGNRTIDHFIERYDLAVVAVPPFNRAAFRSSYGRMAARGLPLREFEEAHDRTDEMRHTYAAELETLIDKLLAPRGFWSHTVTRRMRDHTVNYDLDEDDPTHEPGPAPEPEPSGDDGDPAH
jgi:hypothetical protein